MGRSSPGKQADEHGVGQIAEQLGISRKTVESHCEHIKAKLGVYQTPKRSGAAPGNYWAQPQVYPSVPDSRCSHLAISRRCYPAKSGRARPRALPEATASLQAGSRSDAGVGRAEFDIESLMVIRDPPGQKIGVFSPIGNMSASRYH